MSIWSGPKGADDHIRFEWVVCEENGGWETVARVESGIVRRLLRRMTARTPRWLRRWGWVFVALALLSLIAGGYGYVRYRYGRALRQIEWEIQGVIDLEVHAFERRDKDLFLAHQDDSSVRWCARQVQRFEGNCPSPPPGIDVTPSRDPCRPILPAQVRRVELRGALARVEVLGENGTGPQVYHYRRTALGWRHAMPPPAEDAVTITFACYEWQRAEVQGWAELFQRYYPEIRIEIVALEDLVDLSRPESNIMASATRRVLASADTAFWHIDPKAVRLQVIRDLTPFIEADEGLGFAPFPTQGNPWSVSGYVMSAQTSHPQESWLWLRFLTHRRYTRAFHSEVSARRSVAEQSGYWEQWNESETEAIEWALAHASTMGWDTHATWLWRTVKQVFSGQEAEAALAEAWPSARFRSP
jgi:hypothetical protein